MSNVEDATTHGKHLRDTSIPTLVNAGNYAATASSILTALGRQPA